LHLRRGEAIVQVKFCVYEGAIVAQSNLCRIAKEARILVLEEVSKTYPEVCWHVVLVAEVRGDLRASH
jgi:hypothetical protein